MQSIKKLAKQFEQNKTPLFYVGGFVRNKLLNIPTDDVDLTSYAKLESALDFFKQNNFEISKLNKKLGTFAAQSGKTVVDYATMRKEKYKNDGSHTPIKIEFVKSLKQDAKRRDFTINSIYENVLSEKKYFFFGAKKHIKKKMLKCIKKPDLCFKEDALRIFRLARFSAKYNLSISPSTLKSAIKNKLLIKNLSSNQISKEMAKMPKNIEETKIWQQLLV